MDLKVIHDHILLRVNKDQSGYLSHEDIDKSLDLAQMVRFNGLFGSPITYQPGHQVATPSYGATQKVHDDLAPFKEVIYFNEEKLSSVNNRGTDPSGVAVMPTDYLHMIAMYLGTAEYSLLTTEAFDAGTSSKNTNILAGQLVKLTILNEDGLAFDGNINLEYNNVEIADGTITEVIFYADTSSASIDIVSDVGGTIKIYVLSEPDTWSVVEFLSEDQWANRISSKLLPPIATEPIAKVMTKDGSIATTDANGDPIVLNFTDNVLIQLWPKAGYNLECVYLRRPAAPNYSYTTSGRVDTYSAGNSTQMEWNDQAVTVIIDLACNMLAQNLQDQALDRHTEIKNQQPR